VASLALLGSVVFSAPSANSTICFVVVAGILLLGRTTEPWWPCNNLNRCAAILYTVYFLISPSGVV